MAENEMTQDMSYGADDIQILKGLEAVKLIIFTGK